MTDFVSQVLCRICHSALGLIVGKVGACKGIAELRMLTAPQDLVDKVGLQWKSLKASYMHAITSVPLHQMGLVTHVGKMSTDKTGTTIQKKMDYTDITSMRP